MPDLAVSPPRRLKLTVDCRRDWLPCSPRRVRHGLRLPSASGKLVRPLVLRPAPTLHIRASGVKRGQQLACSKVSCLSQGLLRAVTAQRSQAWGALRSLKSYEAEGSLQELSHPQLTAGKDWILINTRQSFRAGFFSEPPDEISA